MADGEICTAELLMKLEISSMERRRRLISICPIAVLCFAITFLLLSLTFRTVVGQQGYKFYHILPL